MVRVPSIPQKARIERFGLFCFCMALKTNCGTLDGFYFWIKHQLTNRVIFSKRTGFVKLMYPDRFYLIPPCLDSF
ncbi:MAG: hypothetical protein JWP94_573 [Mucilaginibacter sp.]|nr:hypothetical protein [Mucilaginibacter sp.]